MKTCNSSRRWQIVWLLFNAALFTLFGVFHQAGVLRALNHASTTSIANGRPRDLIFFHTYMPPRFMLVNQVPKGKKYVNLIDLNGKNIEKLLETIGSVQKNRIGRKTWIVAPASLHIEEETLIKNYFVSNRCY